MLLFHAQEVRKDGFSIYPHPTDLRECWGWSRRDGMHPPVVRSPTRGTSHELTPNPCKTSHPWILVWHQAGAFSPITDHLSIEILTSLPVVIRLWPFCPNFSLCLSSSSSQKWGWGITWRQQTQHSHSQGVSGQIFWQWQPPKVALELA